MNFIGFLLSVATLVGFGIASRGDMLPAWAVLPVLFGCVGLVEFGMNLLCGCAGSSKGGRSE